MNFGIDLLRHIFSCAVILQHMASASRYSSETNLQLASVINWIDGAVVGFFFISGFLFKKPENLIEYIKKQIIRLLVPFFIFSIAYAVILWALGKSSLSYGIIQTITLHGSGMQLYFLPYLLFVTLSYSWLINKFSLELRVYIDGLMVILFIGLCLLLPTISSTGSDLKLISFYYFSFLAGSLCRVILYLRHWVLIIIAIIFIFINLGFIDSRFFDFAGVIILFAIVKLISQYMPNKRICGSGGVYLLHTPVINFFISTILLHFSVTQWALLHK